MSHDPRLRSFLLYSWPLVVLSAASCRFGYITDVGITSWCRRVGIRRYVRTRISDPDNRARRSDLTHRRFPKPRTTSCVLGVETKHGQTVIVRYAPVWHHRGLCLDRNAADTSGVSASGRSLTFSALGMMKSVDRNSGG